MERKIDLSEKCQNVFLEQTNRTEPPPPTQAHTEQVNAVFTRSGKSDDSSKTQKDPPPPIIKALYGLHQASRAWYETLSTYLLENGYRRGTIDKTLFIKKDRCDILKHSYEPKQGIGQRMERLKMGVHLYGSMIGIIDVILNASRFNFLIASFGLLKLLKYGLRREVGIEREGGVYSLDGMDIREKFRKDSAPIVPTTEETLDEAYVSTPSYDPPQSGEDSMQLSELMNLCTSLQEKVLDLEKAKTAQAKEIASLKKRVKQLEKRRKLRTPGLKRLRKISSSSRVESSNDASLGALEDASKQGRKIKDLDADAEVTLVDETEEMNDDNLMFDTNVLEEQEKDDAKKEVSAANPVTIAGEVVTTANVEVTTVNAPTTTIDELTLAQTLIEIKAAKPKVVTSAATTTTTTRPKARGVAKDKGKGIIVEPEVPLKKKDQIAMDEEVARNLEAQLQAELEEEERISRLKEEKANIALLESWDNTQAMMDADFQLAQQMQTEEQEQLSIEEKSKLFVELLEKRKKHFAALRAQEKRIKPPTKAQKRNIMSTYLKNMARYKHN
ncbi:hypothetical protein Tco_1082911 [Tanacetum coccineum]|uniref:Uncharacterized protein n=1 Tax=Tanacetum coccineum TaxID=301880 RepID=A0ABQ5I1Q5_9ASTR